MSLFLKKKIFILLVVFVIFVFLILIYLFSNSCSESGKKEVDASFTFTSNVYDTIKANYWMSFTDMQLSDIYHRGIDNLSTSSKKKVNYCSTKLGIKKHLIDDTGNLDTNARERLIVDLNKYVVRNLSAEDKISQLNERENIQKILDIAKNIDPGHDPYQNLGVSKSSSPEDIHKRCDTLIQSDINNVVKDCETLSIAKNKAIYDESGIFRTVSSRAINNNSLYIKFDSMSPNMKIELDQHINDFFHNNGYDNKYLIIDLQNNPGGYFDQINYLLSQFLGEGRVLFLIKGQVPIEESNSQNVSNRNYQKFENVIVIVSKGTQSTAEVFAEALKKYDKAIIVGNTTGGVNVASKQTYPVTSFPSPLNRLYELFLVNGMIMRWDNLPMLENGVEPDVDLSREGWQTKLKTLIPGDLYDSLAQVLSE